MSRAVVGRNTPEPDHRSRFSLGPKHAKWTGLDLVGFGAEPQKAGLVLVLLEAKSLVLSLEEKRPGAGRPQCVFKGEMCAQGT